MAIVNDIVLIHIEDQPMSFARVESILPDAKKDWYQIKLLLLQIPLQVVTWILKDDYINGREFHMNEKKMKLEKVESPVENMPSPEPSKPSDQKTKENTGSTKEQAKIISFSDLKRKHEPESG